MPAFWIITTLLPSILLVCATGTQGWLIDTTADKEGTEFRFFNHGTTTCLNPDESGVVWNGGTCLENSEVFTFKLYPKRVQDDQGVWHDDNVIKFYSKVSGKCLTIDGKKKLILETCENLNRLQEWYRFGSWDDRNGLYLQLQNEASKRCMTDVDGPRQRGQQERLFAGDCSYFRKPEFWQLRTVS